MKDVARGYQVLESGFCLAPASYRHAEKWIQGCQPSGDEQCGYGTPAGKEPRRELFYKSHVARVRLWVGTWNWPVQSLLFCNLIRVCHSQDAHPAASQPCSE